MTRSKDDSRSTDSDFEVEELDGDQVDEVSGGSCAGCDSCSGGACGGACSTCGALQDG